jgi:outer membrane protein OmpA-like peptidoglycan-associated protein
MKNKIIIFALALTGALYSCNQNSSSKDNSTADANVENSSEDLGRTDISEKETDADTALAPSEWNGVDLDNYQTRLPEITVKDVETSANEKYTGYSMDETILFEAGASALRPQAKESLQQIVGSISNRAKGKIRIYGYSDAKENKELSKKRAQAVKQWLVQEGKIDASRISIHPMGQSQPEASNKTEAGRKQNRRVEIVAINKE